jgi:hypothetical protein
MNLEIKEGELKMKKLLVLLMVLGLATSAQAALTLSLSATEVDIGDTVTASVSSDLSGTPGIWPGVGDFILSEDTYYWSTMDAAAFSGGWTYHTTAGTSGGTVSVGDLGFANPYPGYSNVYRLNAAGSSVLPEAGVQFMIDIIGVQEGTIYIALQDDTTWAEMAPTLTLVVVPEPMTIALLGLGGLFLRRRK